MKGTDIQWCDDSVNPIMGCWGCELFPKSPGAILTAIDREMRDEKIAGWKRGTAKKLYEGLVAEAWSLLLKQVDTPGVGHINSLTTTNLYHLREQFKEAATSQYGREAGKIGLAVVEGKIKCYAAISHLKRGYAIHNVRTVNIGYAPTFEQVTTFPGRIKKAARCADLIGTDRPDKPWLKKLPRLIFVSDMGDALSRAEDFPFLRDEMEHVRSDLGRRHLWLWLTKRPDMMRKFADSLGGLPDNVCAMTTITSRDAMRRVDDLRKVKAKVRGLSIEPLWSRVADKLDLTGIGWVVVGGESGARANVEPFHLEWAQELKSLCEAQGVAFFMKQLGTRPMLDGKTIALSDKHGGNWDKWGKRNKDLRVRQFPAYFHEYRQQRKASA